MLDNDLNDVMTLLRDLTPLSRTLVHPDNDRALKIISKVVGGVDVEGYPSGKSVWTWRIPNQWQLVESRIEDAQTGELLWDGTCHPLATVNYSLPFSGKLTAEELTPHLHSVPHRPNALPFVFRFYNRDWGFCLPASLRASIQKHPYLNVKIVTDERPGQLKVGVLTIPGKSSKEFIVCTNICHPGTANDSISGACAALALVRHLKRRGELNYTYRFLWLPETIGSVAYFANNEDVIDRAIGGLFIEMLGNENSLCLQHSRKGTTYWDHLAKASLMDSGLEFRVAEFLKSAPNDEKVMDSPGVNIPTISITRYPYPEYHTSDDNVDLISPKKMEESIDFLCAFLDRIEEDYVPIYKMRGPVCLAEHGLYPDWYLNPQLKGQWDAFLKVMYAFDNVRSVESLACELQLPIDILRYWCSAFEDKKFIEKGPLMW